MRRRGWWWLARWREWRRERGRTGGANYGASGGGRAARALREQRRERRSERRCGRCRALLAQQGSRAKPRNTPGTQTANRDKGKRTPRGLAAHRARRVALNVRPRARSWCARTPPARGRSEGAARAERRTGEQNQERQGHHSARERPCSTAAARTTHARRTRAAGRIARASPFAVQARRSLAPYGAATEETTRDKDDDDRRQDESRTKKGKDTTARENSALLDCGGENHPRTTHARRRPHPRPPPTASAVSATAGAAAATCAPLARRRRRHCRCHSRASRRECRECRSAHSARRARRARALPPPRARPFDRPTDRPSDLLACALLSNREIGEVPQGGWWLRGGTHTTGCRGTHEPARARRARNVSSECRHRSCAPPPSSDLRSRGLTVVL